MFQTSSQLQFYSNLVNNLLNSLELTSGISLQYPSYSTFKNLCLNFKCFIRAKQVFSAITLVDIMNIFIDKFVMS